MVLPGELDAPFLRFYAGTVGPYWPPERKLIDDAYRSLAFPFAEIAAPAFAIEVEWTLPRLMDYLSTWSAVKSERCSTMRAISPAGAECAAMLRAADRHYAFEPELDRRFIGFCVPHTLELDFGAQLAAVAMLPRSVKRACAQSEIPRRMVQAKTISPTGPPSSSVCS